jgi:glucose dehydrogenase
MNTPTQIQHPWRTTARTVVWMILGVIVSIPMIWPIVLDEASKAGLTIPDGAKAAAAWLVALIVMVTGVVQRVVLIPRIAAIVAKIPGLSPAPVPDPEPQHAFPAEKSTTAGDNRIVYEPGDGTGATTSDLP